jgi:CubicO group peptidase (beta-lactamase class C family)
MPRWLKWTLFIAGGAIVFATATSGWYLSQAGPVASGFVAKYLCSSTFISRRNPETVFQHDIAPVNPIAGYFDSTIDNERQKVTTSLFGFFSRTAVYRPGCGCTLVFGTTEEKMRKQPLVSAGFAQNRPRHQGGLPWPRGNSGPVNPEDLGVNAPKLKEAVNEAFAEPFSGQQRNTRAVVVVYKGQLIAERYADGYNRNMPLMGWSMSKSITNALAGILVREGKLDIHQSAPVPLWEDKVEQSKITIDHLLRMNSGLEFDEVYQPLSGTTHMLYNSHSVAAYAAAKAMEAEPGSKWQYSSGTSNILAEILRRRMETLSAYYFDYLHDKLLYRIGMFSAVMEPDASGTFVGSSYTLATALDWARFGLLYLQDGLWHGEHILPAGWVSYSTTPTAGAPKGQYGAHFWLNAGSADDSNNRRWPNAPKDAFAALGFQGQNLIIIPSRKTVLVRLGATTDSKAWNTDEFIHQVLAALPQS